MINIAIVTADRAKGERLCERLQGFDAWHAQVVLDQPDPAIRALAMADIVTVEDDVPSDRVKLIMRALGQIGRPPRQILIARVNESPEQLIEYFQLGASAIVQNGDRWTEVVNGLRQIARGDRYLSPAFVPAILERYRELCAVARRMPHNNLH